MGKALLILLAASTVGGSMMLMQAQRTSIETDRQQSKHQQMVLAREIARSAYNAAYSRAREAELEGELLEDIVALVGTPASPTTGSYQGGTYEYWAVPIQGSTYRVGAKGMFADAEHVINKAYTVQTALEVPGDLCPDGCNLETEFIDSQAGYCSAIFLQQLVPKNNDGHGNNEDGVDSSNDGSSKEGQDTDPNVDDEEQRGNLRSNWYFLEPELVFAPGNDRDGAKALYEKTLEPGTRINLILAVDADYTCEQEGQEITIKDKSIDYTRHALAEDTGDFRELKEGLWSIAEEHNTILGRWRIAFEDLAKFNEAQLEDIKKNGYPQSDSESAWDGTTYGGTGWQFDSNGFIKLNNYGHVPDFSDQVIKVQLTPITLETES